MFRSLAQLLAKTGGRPRSDVFLVHPLQLSRWLDEAWTSSTTVPSFDPKAEGKPPFLGSDAIVEALDLPDPDALGGQAPVPSGIDRTDVDVFTNEVFDFDQLPVFETPGLLADHLAYAYLIESTGVFEIMADVVRRLVVGETLDTLSAAGVKWLRATEELFFREPPLFSISGVLSEVRPQHRVNRLNAYWRMFALEPPHPIPARWARPAGVDGTQPWKADIGGGVNTDFREKWAELLRQVWLGIENQNNGVGPNATDAEYVAFLAKALRDMLGMRRRGGQLAREEFAYVAVMSWFHLTVESDTPIVVDLKAEGTSAADRLAKIAQRVGMAPAARARELFELSDLMSALLRAIELGLYDTGDAAQTLFLRFGTNDKVVSDMNRIIDLWQSATGERVKDRPAGTVAAGGGAQPVRLPIPSRLATAAPAPSPAPAMSGPSSDGVAAGRGAGAPATGGPATPVGAAAGNGASA